MKTILYHVTKANLVDSIFKNGLVPFVGPRSYVSGEQEAHIYLCDKESVPMWKALLNADTVLRIVIDDSTALGIGSAIDDENAKFTDDRLSGNGGSGGSGGGN